VLECDFRAAGDEIARTADYAAVAGLLRDECAKGECCLLEALAERLAVRLLVEFPCAAAVELELHKDVLVHARSAGVALRRVRGA
jgi:dihydroneopterin aldolase